MSKYPVFKLNDLALEWCKGQPFKKTDITEQGVSECIHYGELFTKYGVVITQIISKTNVQGKRLSVSGDILFPASDVTPSGLARCSALMHDNVILGGDIIIMRPRPENDSRYLSYAINYQKEQILHRVTGALIKHLSSNALKSVVIPIPPLKKQIDLVEKLEKISTLIACRHQQLQKLNQFASSRFIEMFGDPIRNPKGWRKDELKTHIDILTGYPFDSSKYVENGIKICGGLIIMPGKIVWPDCKYWPSINGFEEYLLDAGDIVLALDRPWISDGFKIACINPNDLPALLIQRTARIRGKDINQRFLFALLNSEAFQKHCNITGSLVPHISHKDVKNFETIIPPLSLQNEFAAFIEQLDKSKVVCERECFLLEKCTGNCILTEGVIKDEQIRDNTEII